jgi:hypothetical protein
MSKATEAWESGIDVSNDPRAVIPDRALVFELIGPVESFEMAAAELGFEWLAGERVARGSQDIDELEDLEGTDAGAGSQLYLTMPTHAGLKALYAKWADYRSGKPSTSPTESALWSLFGYLRDVRAYSARDRIDSALVQYIERLLQRDPQRPVVIEIDLWFRATSEQRKAAAKAVISLLEEESAELVDSVTIEEIQYQAVLIRAPVAVAHEISQRYGRLANADEVMTIRAQSVPDELAPQHELTPTPSPTALPAASAPCFAALLDGYPVPEHEALRGRLVVLESDVTAIQAPVALRYHGTAMASLVLHGDMQAGAHSPLAAKVAVVPVLAGLAGRNVETTPADRLPVGVIYRAVENLMKGSADQQIKPRQITLINHSICGNFAAFTGRPSPWAALLDHLAHKYSVLFVISAGNIHDGFLLEDIASEEELEAADEATRLAAILLGIEKAKGMRRILSPAESVNSLTVGALHADGSGPFPSTIIDPFPNHEMTNLCSAVGPGVNRSLKPDIVEYGGRIGSRSFVADGGMKVRGAANPRVGQRVASPHPAGQLNYTGLVSGTSNAAALVTRTGAQIALAVDEMFRAEGEGLFSRRTRAVILKALIAHGCQWSEVASLLDNVFPPVAKAKWSRRRDTIAAFLGYGRPQPERVIAGTSNRATLLADDEIGHDQLHEYRIPIPEALVNSRDVRRIIVTLAYSSPTSAATSAYRGFTMNIVGADGTSDLWKRVDRTFQPNGHAAARGTLIHTVLEGSTRTNFQDTKGLFIGVQARALSRRFEELTIPYALAVTVELATSQQTSLYADVRSAIRNRTRANARVQQRQ